MSVAARLPAEALPRGGPGALRRSVGRRRLTRLSLGVLVAAAGVALGADLLASDRPLICRLDGTLHVLPALTDPAALRPFDARALEAHLGPGDWALMPPIPWSPNTHDLGAVLSPPTAGHLLGTDASGRDVLSRLVHGTRVSLAVGLLATALLVAVGVLLGGLAGWYGGWADLVVMRVVEVFLSIPTFLLVVTLLAVAAPTGWGAVGAVVAVIGLTRWPDVARLVRGEILRVRSLDYVTAARALGASDLRVLVRHVLPNALGPVLVAATFSVASAILVEGALSFLGFGIPADMASWGGILAEARGNVGAWWLAVFPGLALFVTVTAYNLVGEALRDAVDPKIET